MNEAAAHACEWRSRCWPPRCPAAIAPSTRPSRRPRRPLRSEDAAKQGEAAFDDAVPRRTGRLAKAQGDVLLMQYPQPGRAARRAQMAMTCARKADAAREDARAAALWNYTAVAVDGGTQRAATIDSTQRVDIDGSGAKPVQLVFRDHPRGAAAPTWCCRPAISTATAAARSRSPSTTAPPKAMAGSRPKTDEAIAMFIEDERALWRMVLGAKTLSIEFPVKPKGTRTAVFEVGGVDHAQFPGWY